ASGEGLERRFRPGSACGKVEGNGGILITGSLVQAVARRAVTYSYNTRRISYRTMPKQNN
ncbi:hypothetical protein, partial [Pseudomonas proteolytica]|uniref:hypothetical protein n=1 Tax=Pseudomonas proteolytica TaxID=219574 RepID=UPI0030DA4784